MNYNDKIYVAGHTGLVGSVPEFVEGMWKILQADEPDDYVLATGEMHSVSALSELSFKYVGIPIRFEGEGRMKKVF